MKVARRLADVAPGSWRISEVALDDFLTKRSTQQLSPRSKQRQSQKAADVVEFF